MEGENKTNQDIVQSENIYAILAYLWILCLIPVLMKKENDFVKFHTKQGLTLFIVEIAVGIIAIIPLVGPLVSMVGYLLCGVISLIGIVQVLRGNMWRIPVVSDWAEKINI